MAMFGRENKGLDDAVNGECSNAALCRKLSAATPFGDALLLLSVFHTLAVVTAVHSLRFEEHTLLQFLTSYNNRLAKKYKRIQPHSFNYLVVIHPLVAYC